MIPRPSLLEVGQLIAGCRVLQFLGAGGMGQVFLARHTRLERPVAIKVAPSDSSRPECAERFFKEARMAARIYHPNVVTIHDVGEEAGMYYLVMQYIRGKDLAELVKVYNGPLPWRSAIRLTQLAAAGLEAVHASALVHRDVKPSNIMLAVDKGVFLMDFGLVRGEFEPNSTDSNRVVGTIPFMSPEQCAGGPLDRRSDIFSLGSTLYFLLTNHLPFPGESSQDVMRRIMSGRPPAPIQEFNPEVPAVVSRLLEMAMAPRAGDRFPTASAMALGIRKVLRDWQLRDTSTFSHAQGSGPQISAPSADKPEAVVAAVVVEELLPLDSKSEGVENRMRWVGGAAAAIVAVAVLVWLALHSSLRDRTPSPETANMAYIEAGYARLGDDPAKLESFLSAYATKSSLPDVLAGLTLETRQRVWVPAFFIDRYEVTNTQYASFLAATGWPSPRLWHGTTPPQGEENNPVANIRYEDAEAYARWRNKKLPTREQWMRAFRGDAESLFPWGDAYEVHRGNVGDNKRFRYTSAVDATPDDVSPFGVYNMFGNVSEFLRGVLHHRGQSWRVAKGANYAKAGFRYGIGSSQYLYSLNSTSECLGFRCVVEEASSVPPP